MEELAKTALITGANSGIGFETAAQLAKIGFGKVILVCRTLAKAKNAREQLEQRTGKKVFDILAADLSEPGSTAAAADELANRRDTIDLLILNAGMSTGATPAHNTNGIELTFASTLVGHHVLTMHLLRDQMLADHARIIIAGSEVARGTEMMMELPDFEAFAQEHFNGDLEAAFETILRAEPPYKFVPGNTYATSKVFVAWWAAVMARKLPDGMTVNAVSPGAVTTTNFGRNQTWIIRRMITPIFTLIGPFIGKDGPVTDAAQRYLDAGAFDDQTSGHFFGSPPGKLVGPMQIQNFPHLSNESYQEAFWHVLVRVTGGVDYPQPITEA